MSARASWVWGPDRGALPVERDGGAAASGAGVRGPAVPDAAAPPVADAGAATPGCAGVGGELTPLIPSRGRSLLDVDADRLMSGAEVLRRAADLVLTVGLWRGAFWPGAGEHLPYVEGAPVCGLGAVAVVRGARTESAAIAATTPTDPAHRALIALVGGVETSCVAYESDRWARRRAWSRQRCDGRRGPAMGSRALAERDLQAIYDELPAVACKGLCTDSCTVIDASALERTRLSDAGVELPVRPRHAQVLAMAAEGRVPACSGLSPIGTCRVYDIRPTICRVFGAAAGLRCEHGCVPDRVMPDSEVYAVMAEVQTISDRAVRRG